LSSRTVTRLVINLKHYKLKRKHGLVILLLVLVSACDSATPYPYPYNPKPTSITWDRTKITPLPEMRWDVTDRATRFLQGIPCQPPCYEGITPGKTTATEVVKIMQQSPIFGKARFELDSTGKSNTIWWESAGLPIGEHASQGRMVYSSDAQTEIINLIDTPKLIAHSLTLEQVIKVYGEPGNIEAYYLFIDSLESVTYGLSFIYPDRGFYVFSVQSKTPPILSSDLEIYKVTFFAPGKLKSVFEHPERAKKWEGYKNFSYYCTTDGSESSGTYKVENCDEFLKNYFPGSLNS